METRLLDELAALIDALSDHAIRFTVVGGLGIYLRDEFYAAENRSARYPERPPSRSTEDVDLFLEKTILAEHPERVRRAIDDLEYDVETEYFQFVKSIDETDETTRFDLLAAPSTDEDDLREGGDRVKPPRPGTGLHGRRTPEAVAAERDRIPIPSEDLDLLPTDDGTIFIPSSINFLILKMHAFRDQRHVAHSDEAEHHAFDIFRIVTDMREYDWNVAEAQIRDQTDEPYLRETARIQDKCFGSKGDVGFRRMRQSPNFDSERFRGYLDYVVEDLRALFDSVTPLAAGDWNESTSN